MDYSSLVLPMPQVINTLRLTDMGVGCSGTKSRSDKFPMFGGRGSLRGQMVPEDLRSSGKTTYRTNFNTGTH